MIFERFFKNKFQKDVAWNALSFIVMGVSGIVLNVLILIKYGAEILGAFNQVYAIYILVSQFAVFGLYASVLRYISEHSEDKDTCNQILTSALFTVVTTATLVVLACYFSASVIGNVLNSSNVQTGLLYALIGLWFFSINKILLSFVNGKRLMKAYALFYILRFVMLPLSLIILIILKLPGYAVPLIFSITETVLFISLFIYVSCFFSFTSIRQCRTWFKAHLPFGGKSLIGGSISEINTRVDVLMLGAFVGDKIVGIYSFAAMLAEGLDQIPGIFRVNYNPLLIKLVIAKKFDELKILIRLFLKKWMPWAFLLGVLAVFVFPVVVNVIFKSPELLSGWAVFAILLAGIVLKSGYSVFWELPSQSGYPGHQTGLLVFVTVSNVILNYIFIFVLRWGMNGAAIATALSFVLGVLCLKIIVQKTLKVGI